MTGRFLAGLVGGLLGALAMAVTSLVMFGASPAYACSCVVASDAEHAERADMVFVGSITGTETVSSGSNVEYDVAVDQVFKGEVGAEATVVTGSHGTACGLPDLPEGKPLIFFASEDATGLRVSSCDGTGTPRPSTINAVTAVLGGPSAPHEGDGLPSADEDSSVEVVAEGGDDDQGASWAPWLGGALLVAVAATVGGGVLLRRRSA